MAGRLFKEPSRTSSPSGNPLAVPTQTGEYYIPALGKSFQQIELRNVAHEFSQAAFDRWMGRGGTISNSPLHLHCRDGRFTGCRLADGSEMAVTSIMLIGPVQPGEETTNVHVRINTRELCFLNPALLRAHSSPHVTPEALTKLTEAIPVVKSDDLKDLLIGVQALLARTMATPMLGYHFTIPQQIRDNDDINIEGIPNGNALFLMGIEKLPLGR